MHKGVGKKISIDKKPHKSYPGSGVKGLINGISGSTSRFGDKEWLGFWGDDIEIVINLGEEMEINSIETRFNNTKSQWIYAPKEFEISFDDNDYQVYEIGNSENNLVNIHRDYNKIKVQTIKIKVPNYGVIPDGQQGAGNKAWTFIDEIIIN